MILNCMDPNECDGVYYEIKIIAGPLVLLVSDRLFL